MYLRLPLKKYWDNTVNVILNDVITIMFLSQNSTEFYMGKLHPGGKLLTLLCIFWYSWKIPLFSFLAHDNIYYNNYSKTASNVHLFMYNPKCQISLPCHTSQLLNSVHVLIYKPKAWEKVPLLGRVSPYRPSWGLTNPGQTFTCTPNHCTAFTVHSYSHSQGRAVSI